MPTSRKVLRRYASFASWSAPGTRCIESRNRGEMLLRTKCGASTGMFVCAAPSVWVRRRRREKGYNRLRVLSRLAGANFSQRHTLLLAATTIHCQLMSARLDHRNLRMLCRLLVDSLESSECVLTQYGLVRIVIDTAEPGEETIAVRNITEATLDAAFKWLTRARSAEELEKLCSASCHCTRTSSNMDYARAHERGRQLMEGNSVTGSV
jgi:hypothetical protein